MCLLTTNSRAFYRKLCVRVSVCVCVRVKSVQIWAHDCSGPTVCVCNCVLAFCMCQCVHVVSLWKAQRCHRNTEKSTLARRDLGKERVLSPPLGDSYSLAFILLQDSHSSCLTHALESFRLSLFIFFQSIFISISLAALHLLTIFPITSQKNKQ